MNGNSLAARRSFLVRSLAAAGGAVLATTASPARAAAPRDGGAPSILLRGSWQSVNIGDIGHTPGALGLIEKYFPAAEVTLWSGAAGEGVRDPLGLGARQMLAAAFPRLKFVSGAVDDSDQPTTRELAQAWEQADLYLSGSGSGFPASAHAIAFYKTTGKPVGVFGVSADPISGYGSGRDPEGGTLKQLRQRALDLPPHHLSDELRYIIDRAAFFFCRDTISRDYLKAQQVRTPILEFGPDAQLGMRLRDQARGDAWLAMRGLEAGKYICVIPRLRYTPYHKIRKTAPNEVDRAKDALNDRTTEPDHAKLREMIANYVQATGNKVVVCAEMTYQVELGKSVLVDPLPPIVRRNVVWRDSFWLPDEAAAVYARAACVVSMECHSPLIALHQGTPAMYVRQPTDTCKGQMYRDFGADDWLLEVEETSGEQLWSRLEAIHRDSVAARDKVQSILSTVEVSQKRMVGALKDALAR